MYHFLTHSHRTAGAVLSLALLFALAFSPLFAVVALAEEVDTTTATAEDEAPAAPEPEEPEEVVLLTLDPNDGEDGESGEIESEDPSIIVTGDAVAGLEQETNTNFNETTVETSSSTDEVVETGTSTPPVLPTIVDDSAPTTSTTATTTATSTESFPVLPGNTTNSTTNDALIDNNATTSADSGGNTAGGDGSLIVTGDAVAYANVVNLANTNIFNSNGLIAFFSSIFGISSYDLRNAFSSIFETTTNAVSTPSCSLSVCEGGDATLNVENGNNATINNNVSVTANTGHNAIYGEDGAILTGDAYAAANIFNLANTNITDSNYLLLSFNNFGDYAGDIILPSGDLLDSLFGAGGGTYSNLTSTNTNNATVTNSVNVGADTGGNETDGGAILTGDAYGSGSVENIVNTNLFGGSDLLLVLRIHGDWNGEIFGLPDGLAWTETPEGIVLYSTGSGAPGASATGDVTVTNTNNATINNNVSVFALTGDNKVGGDGTIATGDAYAAANVTNVANTNILGKNWALLVFDIFGNWNGNLSFGQPDLWIGAKATPKSTPVMPGAEVEYTYTITNRGDSKATNVIFDQLFNDSELSYDSAFDAYFPGAPNSKASWNLGTINPGETKTLTYTTHVKSGLPDALMPISVEASVTAHENDANDDDNSEVITIYSGKEHKNTRGSMKSFPTNVEVVKTASSDTVAPGDSVEYTITLTNHGGPLFRSVLRDILRHEDGEMISEQYWELGTILTDETVSVSYTMQFGEDAKLGTYTNTADIAGLEIEKSWQRGVPYSSDPATHELTMGGEPAVLGISSDSCPPYLTSFMRYGVDNDPDEVLKLQTFLNEHSNAGLGENGTFDEETREAVAAFQLEYADEILTPWGTDYASGYVYLTTRKMINMISCEYTAEFPLSSSQEMEIERYKNGLDSSTHNNSTSPLPLFGKSDTEADEEITQKSEEAVKEEIARIEEEPKFQTTTPSYSADKPPRALVAALLRALYWFRDLAQY